MSGKAEEESLTGGEADDDNAAGRDPNPPQPVSPIRATSSAVDGIRWQPMAWPKFPGWDRLPVVRRRRVESFPYSVIYFVRGNELVIVAFAHQRRRPGYWMPRVDDFRR